MVEVETRISLKCELCGSRDITLKEYSIWNETDGEWIPDGASQMYCEECGSTSIDIRDVPVK